MVSKIKRNSKEYVRCLVSIINSKDEFHVWHISDLLKELNSILPKKYNLTIYQLPYLLRRCKHYNIFRDSSKRGWYIFLKRKKKIEDYGDEN